LAAFGPEQISGNRSKLGRDGCDVESRAANRSRAVIEPIANNIFLRLCTPGGRVQHTARTGFRFF
jgi:hypothetical protein